MDKMKEVGQFTATIGVNAGYGHGNAVADAVAAVGPIWQDVAALYHEGSGVYVGGTVTAGKSVYAEAWGCPPGGEVVAVVMGVRNPQFTAHEGLWRDAVRSIAAEVGRRLGQKTVYLTFSTVDFDYIVNP